MHKTLKKITHKIIEHYAPQEIMLFGSYAKQTHHALSDIDLLVVWETALPRRERLGVLADYIHQFPMKVDLHIYTPAEIAQARQNPHSFISSIFLTGVKIYEKNSCAG